MLSLDLTRIIFALGLLLTVCGCGSEQAKPKVTDPLEEQDFESYVLSQNFSGAVYIARAGEILLNKGFGLANKESEQSNTPETRFRIGSVSKQFTAAAILTLQEQGLLSVNDYISDHLSDFPNGTQITLKHLLTHTSGLPNYTALPDFEDYLNDELTPDEIMAMFKDLPLEFVPGSAFKYSNSGYVVLGAIIEQVSGIAYADYMALHVFAPLQMDASGYGTNEPVAPLDAKGYKPDGSLAPYIDMSLPYAAGALVSTLGDLAKWDKALYDNTLLSTESTELMFTPELNGYGLGWQITNIAETEEPIHVHGGNIAGFSAVIVRFPITRKLIVVLSNTDDYPVNKLAVNLNLIAVRQ